MKYTPHQRFSEYVDESIVFDTLEFHSKSHYGIFPAFKGSTYLTAITEPELTSLTYADVCINPVGPRFEATAPEEPIALPWRNKSGVKFDSSELSSFQTASMLAAKTLMAQPDIQGLARMPYPSAGAMYPIIAVLCRTSSRTADWPTDANILQILPSSRQLQAIDKGSDPESILDVLSGGSRPQLGDPAFAFVFALHLDRSLFKYRYRGYRLANMEVGAMYQQVAAEAQAKRLKTRVWAGFSDYHVAALLKVDCTQILPMAVQFVGA